MKQNMGAIDRILRLIVAVILAVMYNQAVITGPTGIVLFVFAFILALTAIVGSCPIYTLLGINSCSAKKHV